MANEKIITIAEMQKAVHENAKAHGWWDEPRTPGELLMLITSEVAEAFAEIRNGHEVNEIYYKDGKPEGAPVEIADIVLRCMDLCEYYGIDLGKVMQEKHEYNLTRPYKHGGKRM